MSEYNLFEAFETTLKRWILYTGASALFFLFVSLTPSTIAMFDSATVTPITIILLILTLALIMIWTYLYPSDLSDREVHHAIKQLREKGYLVEVDFHGHLDLSYRGAVFVKHIQDHLKDDELVICTICNKSVDRIYSEYSALDEVE